jgi:hypothetical protein
MVACPGTEVFETDFWVCWLECGSIFFDPVIDRLFDDAREIAGFRIIASGLLFEIVNRGAETKRSETLFDGFIGISERDVDGDAIDSTSATIGDTSDECSLFVTELFERRNSDWITLASNGDYRDRILYVTVAQFVPDCCSDIHRFVRLNVDILVTTNI